MKHCDLMINSRHKHIIYHCINLQVDAKLNDHFLGDFYKILCYSASKHSYIVKSIKKKTIKERGYCFDNVIGYRIWKKILKI